MARTLAPKSLIVGFQPPQTYQQRNIEHIDALAGIGDRERSWVSRHGSTPSIYLGFRIFVEARSSSKDFLRHYLRD
ncbi:hypothetical protein PGTUg99_027052 [Puccinia graminis f. sp. tritici]|uniref:Uncharacterized protein n=1 Tax=Puccinia graminis f. sp. tritici TaxID=56615 RepID=A0A5B0RB88_PUCGR|nr:hypothetical protein PGTUg99_027052 [Puccinia graminis f. sp. tritici]